MPKLLLVQFIDRFIVSQCPPHSSATSYSSGWYDRKVIGSFKNLVDINFLVALGPPGGGRNPLTSRIVRHFNILTFCNLQDDSKERIFNTILQNHLIGMPGEGRDLSKSVTRATIKV